MCVYVDQNCISTGNSLISSPDLDSPQKINLEWYLLFNGSLQITLLQIYFWYYKTIWDHSTMDASFFSKLLSQLECRDNKKSCHLLEKKGTHPMRMHDNNTTCNRSNQNASLPDTCSHSTNQHLATPDTTKTMCFWSAAQCWKAFLVLSNGLWLMADWVIFDIGWVVDKACIYTMKGWWWDSMSNDDL